MASSSSSSPPSTSSSRLDLDGLDAHDESVRIAVRALGDMRNSAHLKLSSPTSFQPTPALSIASSSSTPSLPSPALEDEDADNGPPTAIIHRASNHPLFNTALRAYEHGKASSRVVKYGAEMMESSVKTISRPVIDRLPVNVEQIDEFAGRQLDRLDRYRRPSSSDPERMQTDPEQQLDEEKGGQEAVPSWLEATSPFIQPPPPPPDSRTPTPSLPPSSHTEVAVAQRSRWAAVLTEAGGISAALSEESMRRLKYCLQWLQYATAHIDAQILILRDFTASLQPLPPSSDTPISPTHLRTLTDVRRDVVHTVRQVVDVVSTYAGGALPGQARERVRGFILHLPQRWAASAEPVRRSRHGSIGGTGAVRSHASSPASSRAASPLASRLQGQPTAGTAAAAAQRILVLATESLDMMRGVTGVVKDSLDRADAWVGRLRVVGLQRERSGERVDGEGLGPPGEGVPAEAEGGECEDVPPIGCLSIKGEVGEGGGMDVDVDE